MKIGETVYVEKAQYDILLRQRMFLKFENDMMKKAWSELKDKANQFDDHVLDDIHRFDSLGEENAYIIGSFNTMIAIKKNIKELEELYFVKDCEQQNKV